MTRKSAKATDSAAKKPAAKKAGSKPTAKPTRARGVKASEVQENVTRKAAAQKVGVAEPAPKKKQVAPKKASPKRAAGAPGEDGTNPFRALMRCNRAPEPATLVIFGATGDLSRRKLLPAVFGLWQDGLLGSAFNIVGVGRQEMTDEQFKDYAIQALKDSKETDAIQPGSLEKFRELLY